MLYEHTYLNSTTSSLELLTRLIIRVNSLCGNCFSCHCCDEIHSFLFHYKTKENTEMRDVNYVSWGHWTFSSTHWNFFVPIWLTLLDHPRARSQVDEVVLTMALETFFLKGHVLNFLTDFISESISVIQHAVSYAGLYWIQFAIMMSSFLI